MARSKFGYNTSKYDINRKNFTLTVQERKEIKLKINKIILTDEDLEIIQSKIDQNLITDYIRREDKAFCSKEDFIHYSYIMRFKLELPLLHMAAYLSVNHESFFKKIKALGWAYSTSESQQIASEKSRDYTSIRSKAKKTILDNGFGTSNTETKIRQYLNLTLTELLPFCDVIVGENNISILSTIKKEIDIPIIIFKNDKVYKFAVEVNGYYWHIDKDNSEKVKTLRNKGYTFFEIWQCSTNEQREEIGVNSIEEQINMIINKIVKCIK